MYRARWSVGNQIKPRLDKPIKYTLRTSICLQTQFVFKKIQKLSYHLRSSGNENHSRHSSSSLAYISFNLGEEQIKFERKQTLYFRFNQSFAAQTAETHQMMPGVSHTISLPLQSPLLHSTSRSLILMSTTTTLQMPESPMTIHRDLGTKSRYDL